MITIELIALKCFNRSANNGRFTGFQSSDVANLLGIIQGNAFLNELYTDFINAGGTIAPGGKNSGTHSNLGVIIIQSSWLPSNGSSLTYPKSLPNWRTNCRIRYSPAVTLPKRSGII